MGYRSTVVIGITKEVLTRNLITNEIPKCVLELGYHEQDGAAYFVIPDWKWNSVYPEVAKIKAWFESMDEKALEQEDPEYGAVRMGDDGGDVEEWGDPLDFDIFARQYIEYPQPPNNPAKGSWEAVFGHLGTPDEVGNEWHRLQEENQKLKAWRDAVIEQLVVHHIYQAKHDEEPMKALQDLLAINQQIALDPAVSAEAQALVDTNGQKLRGFIQALFKDWPEAAGVDGFLLQDMAVEHGLLKQRDTPPTEPCGEGCACAEYYPSQDFKDGGVICYVRTSLLTGEPEAKNENT